MILRSSILRSRLDNAEKDLQRLIYSYKYRLKEAEKGLKKIKELKRKIK